MRLSHSISMTLFVSLTAFVSACSDEASDDGGTATGGTSTGGTATGGTATGGTATGGTATGGTATGGTATGGSAGSGTGGAAGSGVSDHPTDTTQAGIEAFLAAESYKTAMGWRPESMPSAGTAQPHLAARRYFNETIIASHAAGNAPPSMGQHTSGSMSVKEILDGTTVVGKAATLRTDTNWVYYCMSSVANRCFTNSPANMAYYGTTAGSCACHGSGANLSRMAIPAP